MNRARSLLLVLILGCGCPQAAKDHPAPAPPATEPVAHPTEAPATDTTLPANPPTGSSSQATGPVGPSRHNDRIPSPEDGRAQTDLLQLLELKVGEVQLQTWIANQRRSRTLGLMHVRSMPEDHGMLFVYPDVGRRAFWMRNTYIPLSLAYIRADGTIEQILDMEPLTEVSHPSNTAVKFVLEVNQGWFHRHGITTGTRMFGLEDLRGF